MNIIHTKKCTSLIPKYYTVTYIDNSIGTTSPISTIIDITNNIDIIITTSENTFPGDWERKRVHGSLLNSLPPGDLLHCREPHMFPREDLGILGHIEKLEFHIMTLVTE